MAHIVTCVYCKQKFDRDRLPFSQISERRFAHIVCAQRAKAEQDKTEKDKEILYEYIKQLFNTDTINPRILKQLKEYINEYQYTYNGILHALKYWYEVKKNDINKANGALGIVPFIYKQSIEYYETLWLAAEKNKDKDFNTFIPEVREITILSPKRNIIKRKKFSFLDEEVENE